MVSVEVERWDVYEILFETSYIYENPFKDVELTAVFTHENGKKIEVDGFYDGGPVWRIRFMPTEVGIWEYITKSSDPDLDRKEGRILCVPPRKPFLHGPIRAEGFHFIHADGTRRFLVSTRLSCHFAPQTVWQRVINFLKKYEINRVLFIMGGIAGTVKDLYGKNSDCQIDFSRYNIKNFQAIDAFIDTLRHNDILASPYFYYFNDGVQRLMLPEQDKAYIRYGMARFGAYANVMPVLCNQVEGKFTLNNMQYNLASHTWANEMGSYLAEKAAKFGLPVSVHNPLEAQNAINPSYYTILKDWQFPWANFMLRQMQIAALSGPKEINDDQPEWRTPIYNARGYARQNQLLIELRRYGIPVINEEPGYENTLHWIYEIGKWVYELAPWNSQTLETLVPTYWSAVTAGVAGIMWGSTATYELDDPFPKMKESRVPECLKILHDFVSSLPYGEMEPANDLVSANEVLIDGQRYRTNFCLANREVYMIFSLNGGSGNITLMQDKIYDVIRLNPFTGELTNLGKVSGGTQTFSLPEGSWLLLYKST